MRRMTFRQACDPGEVLKGTGYAQGFTVFGDILTWFQKQNNWAGWAIFLAMYTANVSLLLPGIVLILGSGFVFG
jgi:uncharacterized membrane protein YdjX (TVP38/TMEM64 family)